MNAGVAQDSRKGNWFLSGRGSWLSYCVLVGLLHTLLRCLPWFEARRAHTLTALLHNIVTYKLLHTIKGAPWEIADQGKSRRLTLFEQLDHGYQFSATRKFLTVVPIVLFILTNMATQQHSWTYFGVNVVVLLIGIVPKLPVFQKLRFFDINKY